MTTETIPKKGRKLNMVEKRRLEKVLFDDIDRTTNAYMSRRQSARNQVEERVKKQGKVRTLFDLYCAAKRLMEERSKNLETLGFGISSYSGSLSLYVSQGSKVSDLREYDSETERVRQQLSELKRTYTLKLFAGGEEAKELFASLARELAAIVK